MKFHKQPGRGEVLSEDELFKRRRENTVAALTVEIVLAPVDLSEYTRRLTNRYNALNAWKMLMGHKNPMRTNSVRCRRLAVQGIRHELTNYDDICQQLPNNHPAQLWQIIFCRTMRMIGEAYPKLRPYVERDVLFRLPLLERSPVCMPKPFPEVLEEVRRKAMADDHTELHGQDLVDHFIRYVLDFQTYFNEQADLFRQHYPKDGLARVDALRTKTVALIRLAYPELEDLGTTVSEHVSEHHNQIPEEKAPNLSIPLPYPLKKPPLPEVNGRETESTRLPARVPTVPVSPLGLGFTYIPYGKLMKDVTKADNMTRPKDKKRFYLTASPAAQLKLQRRAVRYLRTNDTNLNLLLSRASQLPEEEREMAVAVVKQEAIRILTAMYPELEKAIRIELNHESVAEPVPT